MSRTVLALVMVAASASAASAGGFIGLGIGTGAASSGEVPVTESGRSGRLMLGYRFGATVGIGQISIEGLGTRYDMHRSDGHDYTGTTLALAGRYNIPLGNAFEVFGRLGLQHTGLEPKVYQEPYSGTGFLVGAGFELRIPVGSMTLAPFVDYSIYHAGMANTGRGDFSLTSRIWTLGATLAF